MRRLQPLWAAAALFVVGLIMVGCDPGPKTEPQTQENPAPPVREGGPPATDTTQSNP